MNEAATPRAAGDAKTGSVVFDIGYQRYAGPREGRGRARLAVYKDGVRKALGLGRTAKAKLLPWAFISLMVVIGVIAAVSAGIAQRNLGDMGAEMAPGTSHEFYYSITIIILFVFAALVAPRLLCPDRRNGTIHLYLVRPLTATNYVAARWAAFLTVMLLVAWLPQFVLLAGRVLGHPDPLAYLDANWTDLPKFLLSGAAIAVMVTTVAMFASALATRRGYASVLLIALYLIPAAVTEPLGYMPQLQWVSAFSLSHVLGDMNTLIFTEAGTVADAVAQEGFGNESLGDAGFSPPGLSSTLLFAAYFGWLLTPGGLLWTYYRRLTP